MVQRLSTKTLNKYYAQVRLINFHQKRNLMQEIFYDINTWPRYMIEIFVKPLIEYTYSDR